MEFYRGGVEFRILNTGATRRKEYVDVGEVGRRIESIESDLVPLVIRLGWTKEREKRIAIVERIDGDASEDELQEAFGLT